MTNLKEALQVYGKESIKQAKSNLNLTGFAGKKRKTNNTKALSDGLGFDVIETATGYDVIFTTKEEYGIFIERGVNGWKKSQGSRFKFKGKNLAKGVMEEYIKTSKMRLRKVFINKNGQKVSKFVTKSGKEGEKNIKAAAFMMGRAIARDGIIKTNFMSKAQERAFEESKEKIAESFAFEKAFEMSSQLRKMGFDVKLT